jgi:hypothetical protein
MNAPIKPRYTYVDRQIDDLRRNIANSWFVIPDINREFWNTNGCLSDDDNNTMFRNIREAFEPMMETYKSSIEVMTVIEQLVILIQNCFYFGVNIPTTNTVLHIIVFATNNMNQVFGRVAAPMLRASMIKANHNCEVIQRVWRVCDTNPEHPMCRRRLEREFEELRG